MFGSLSRRKFFAFAAAAPAAGRAVVEKSAAELSLDHSGLVTGGYGIPQPCAPDRSWIHREIGRLVREIAEVKIEDVTPDSISRVTRLDADLAFGKSMSMTTKMRIQAQRNARNGVLAAKAWREREIEQYKKQLLGL